jgi:uncharacterized membrane protein YeaQ/YmgE (transglycosylase-associated protein family)
MGIIWTLLIGIAAGWLAGQFMKGGSFGLVGDLVLGILGSVLGSWIFGALGLMSGGGIIGSLVVSTVGAVALLWLVRLIKKT